MSQVVPLMASADHTWQLAAQRIEALEAKNTRLIGANRIILAELDHSEAVRRWQRRALVVAAVIIGALVAL